jgi:uncharacterized protein (DUF4415 family)
MQANPASSANPAPVRRAVKRKTRITIYLDDAILEQFRALSHETGMGYQTLINAVLRQQVPALPHE